MLYLVPGSRCYERFTGNQILKRVQQEGAAINKTERVSLISSMMLGEGESKAGASQAFIVGPPPGAPCCWATTLRSTPAMALA